jgi:hypothetical protein
MCIIMGYKNQVKVDWSILFQDQVDTSKSVKHTSENLSY